MVVDIRAIRGHIDTTLSIINVVVGRIFGQNLAVEPQPATKSTHCWSPSIGISQPMKILRKGHRDMVVRSTKREAVALHILNINPSLFKRTRQAGGA